jgi:hypothetical protein
MEEQIMPSQIKVVNHRSWNLKHADQKHARSVKVWSQDALQASRPPV